jgi:hypothetical protein
VQGDQLERGSLLVGSDGFSETARLLFGVTKLSQRKVHHLACLGALPPFVAVGGRGADRPAGDVAIVQEQGVGLLQVLGFVEAGASNVVHAWIRRLKLNGSAEVHPALLRVEADGGELTSVDEGEGIVPVVGEKLIAAKQSFV